MMKITGVSADWVHGMYESNWTIDYGVSTFNTKGTI